MCSDNDCGDDRLCVALTKGVCLALYSSDLTKRLTCRQYMCGKSRLVKVELSFKYLV